MDSSSILLIFMAIVLSAIFSQTVLIVLANFRYEARQIQSRFNSTKTSQKINICLICRNDQAYIRNSLANISKLKVNINNILILDNKSQDETKQLISKYMKNQKLNIKLVKRRSSNISEKETIYYIKKYLSNNQLLITNPKYLFNKNSINLALKDLNINEEYDGVVLRIIRKNNRSLSGLFGVYQNFLDNRFNKYLSESGIKVTGPALIKNPKNYSKTKFYYSTSAKTFYYEKSLKQLFKSNLSRQFNIFKNQTKHLYLWPHLVINLLASICLPLILIYAIFLAVILHEPSLLIIFGCVYSALMLLTIWQESSLKFRYKLKLSVLLPLTFYYIITFTIVKLANIVQLVLWPEFLWPSQLKSKTI